MMLATLPKDLALVDEEDIFLGTVTAARAGAMYDSVNTLTIDEV